MNYSFASRENIYGIILLYSIVPQHIYQQYSSWTLIKQKQKRIEIFIRLGKQLFMSNTETRWKGIFPALSLVFYCPLTLSRLMAAGAQCTHISARAQIADILLTFYGSQEKTIKKGNREGGWGRVAPPSPAPPQVD